MVGWNGRKMLEGLSKVMYDDECYDVIWLVTDPVDLFCLVDEQHNGRVELIMT